MSWLGGLNDSFSQLSSLTGQLGGQISNFTKEVLTEGADGAIDYEVETHKLRGQLKQNEAVLHESEALAKHLQQENSVLKNKLHTAELNISTTGIEYEARLQQANKEINQLKEQLSRYGDGEKDAPRQPVLPSTFSSVSLGDDDDFHDVISYQRQINHLSRELDESRSECEKWKRKAERAGTQAPVRAANRHATEEDTGALIARVKELEIALRREADHHEQENRTMQDAHMATVSRYQEEIRKLKQNLVSSPAESSFDESQSSSVSDDDKIRSHRQDIEKMKNEMDVLKEQLRTKTRQFQIQKKRIDELTASCKQIEDKENATTQQLNSLQSSMQIKLGQLTDVIRKKDEILESIMSGVQEFAKLGGIQFELMNESNVWSILTEVKDRYLHLVKEKDQLSVENLNSQSEIHRLVEIVNDRQETDRRGFEAENQDEKGEMGDMYDMELAESDQWHQDRVNQRAEDDQDMEDEFVAESDQYKRKEFLPRHLNLGQPLSHSSPHAQSASTSRRLREEDEQMEEQDDEDVALPGDLTLTLQALQKQVEDYELEIKQYEQVQSEWQHEKQSLQELLNRYQSEIVQDDQDIVASKEPEDERAAAITQLRKELQELQDVRGNLEREKIRLVQEKEQLQVAAKNLEEELNSSISETQTQQGLLDNFECDKEKHADEKRRLQAAFDNLSQELNTSRMEKDELDKALDTLDSQHQDEMNQLLVVRDELKKQLANAKSEIKGIKSEKDDLAEQLKTLQAQMDVFVSNNKQEDHRHSALEQELTESNNIRLKLQCEVANVKKDVDNLQEEQQRVLLENEEVELKVNELETEKDEIKEENKRLLDENVNMRKQVTELKNQCHSLQHELDEAKKSFQGSKLSEIKLQEANLRIKTLEKDVKIQESQQSDKQIEELRESLSKKKEHIDQLLKEKDSLLQLEEQEDILAAHVKKLENDLESLKAELEEKQRYIEKIKVEKQSFEKIATLEASRIQEENDSLGLELENAGKEMAQAQSKHNDALKKLQLENQDAIKEAENGYTRRLAEVEERHLNYKIDAEMSNKVYIDKVNHFEKENKALLKKLEDLENSKSSDDKNDFFEMNQSWEVKFNKSHEEHSDLTKILKEQTSKLSEQIKNLSTENDQLKSKFQNELSSLETKLKQEQESKTQLQKLVQHFQDSKMSEMAVLQTELINAKKQISTLNTKISSQENQNSNNFNGFNSERSEEQNLQQKEEYELKISELQKEMEVLKNTLARHELTSKSSSEIDVDKMLEQIRSLDIGDLEKSDLSKDDIGSLLRLIKERDEVISLLTQQRSAASHNTTASVAAITQLEDANRALITEKDQILSVISEKTKENRKLKDESHKMMNVVAEARAALSKVQQENAELIAKYEGYDREMTKEAVDKLSRLVREKELEIESLKQKCGTLLEVLQQQSPGGDSNSSDVTLTGQQVQGLLKDKETLMGQVQQLLNERNHLVALVNQKQAESEAIRVELLQAAEALERDADNNSKLQISYGNLVHDYEQTQMKLASVQKELSFFKEKLNHLEEAKEILLAKVDVIEPQQYVRKLAEDQIQKLSDHPTSGEHKTPDLQGLHYELHKKSEALYQKDILLQKASEEQAKYESEHEKLLNDMKEKDLLIHSRTEKMNHSKRELASKSNEVEILRKSVENLREQVSGLDRSSREAREEVRSIASRLSEKEAESQAFQETNAQLSMLLKEKEYEVEEAKDKCRRLDAVNQQKEKGQESESQRLLVQLDDAKQCLIAAKHERDQVMLSLKQKKMEADKCGEEARFLREKEVKLESELARLRNHLIQVEEAYTQEAMLAEDREKSLQGQLDHTRSTNSAVREATEQSQQQAESLQEQLRTAISQRDQAIQQYHLTQEQSIQYANALQKLQVAVEQMQREEAAGFAEQIEKIKQQFEKKANEVVVLESQMEDMRTKLENANEALESASRLNKQLELKEENIEQLKSIVAEKQLQVDEVQDRIHKISSKHEGMVDKEIVKNLVIGYFTAPSNQRDDILRLITGVLEFSSTDRDRVKTGPQGGKKGWISGWIWGSGKPPQQGANMSSPPLTKDALNESFTQMFIKFLENESNPHQAARLPMETMINEARQKTQHRRTLGSPGFSAVPTPLGTTASERTAPMVAGRYSPFLLTNTLASTPVRAQMNAGATNHPFMMQPVTPILPTFAPITNPKPSAEREILQDILYSNGER